MTYLIFIALGVLAAQIARILFARKKPPDPPTQNQHLPLTQGTVMIDGKPTSVLLLTGADVEKTTRSKQTATFKPLPRKKFKLLE